MILDTTNVDAGQEFTALFWGVAQVAQLQNIKIQMPQSKDGQGHSGIRLQRGSTLGLANVRVENGLVGRDFMPLWSEHMMLTTIS